MKTIKLSTTQNIELEYKVAGLGDRILATIIDNLIFTGIFMLFGLASFLFSDIDPTIGGYFAGTFFVIIFTVYVFYHLLCEIFLNGQSIGKRIMKIKVVRIDGNHPTIGNYAVRWVMRIVDIGLTNGMGAIICIAATEKGQRIGDLAAGTTVISTKDPTEFKETIFEEFEPGYAVQFPEVRDLQDKDIHLIKEILNDSEKVENPEIILELVKKLKTTLGINTKLPPRKFVTALLKDYNYLNSEFDDI